MVARLRHRSSRRAGGQGMGHEGLDWPPAAAATRAPAVFHLHAVDQHFLLPGPTDAVAEKRQTEPPHRPRLSLLPAVLLGLHFQGQLPFADRAAVPRPDPDLRQRHRVEGGFEAPRRTLFRTAGRGIYSRPRLLRAVPASGYQFPDDPALGYVSAEMAQHRACAGVNEQI